MKKILLVLAALALVGLFAGAALAQESATPNRPDADAPAFFQTFLEKFASALGVDKDKVVAAAKEAGKQVVDEAVQQGKMTPEQAARIKNEIDQGQFFPCPFPRHGAARLGGPRLDALAQALGMTADELKAELKQGKKISDIAKEKGLTEEQLRQKVVEAKIQAIQQAAKEGKIPQDRADEMIKRLQNAPQGKGPKYFGRPFGPLFAPPTAGQQAQ
ncbi:MAG: Fis family transcriptional regulator [Bacillota bacterium]